MNSCELISMLFARGVRLFVRGGKLHYRASSDAYTHELQQLVDENRPELTAWLSTSGTGRPCICGSTEGEYHAIHGGQSVRQDCAKCRRFVCFPVWNGVICEK